MRNSPGVKRAAVHRFATDGSSALAPKRPVEQALKHEVVAPLVDGIPADEIDTSEPPIAGIFQSGETVIGIAPKVESVALRVVTTEDVDQLWDWTRQDAEGVKDFLGIEPKNSRDLFKGIERVEYLQMEQKAWIRAITRGDDLAGFALIAPIQRPQGQPPVGTVHLYIAKAQRGDLSAIVSGLLASFDSEHEPMTLSVIASRPEWSRILEPLGFLSATVLTRPAVKPDGSTWA